MKDAIELAKSCDFTPAAGYTYILNINDLKKLIDAAKAEGAAKFKASLGEPVAWQFFDGDEDEWFTGAKTNNHKQNTIDAGHLTRELYALKDEVK